MTIFLFLYLYRNCSPLRRLTAAVKTVKLLAQSTGDFTREELKKDVKLSWTDKAKAEIAAAKGSNSNGEESGSNGQSGQSGNTGGSTGGTTGGTTGGDTGGDTGGGDNNGGGGGDDNEND